MMAESWCNLAQSKELCQGCKHDQGREKSLYQIERDKDMKPVFK